MEQELREEVERVKRSFKRELVLYEPPAQALVPPAGDEEAIRIPIRRSGR
jgi:hypothetical protein